MNRAVVIMQLCGVVAATADQFHETERCKAWREEFVHYRRPKGQMQNQDNCGGTCLSAEMFYIFCKMMTKMYEHEQTDIFVHWFTQKEVKYYWYNYVILFEHCGKL